MAEKDLSEKLLEEYDDVFADIVNVLLFDGMREVKEEELAETGTESQYKADDSALHEQERDVAKYWKNGKIRLALYGIENQTQIDKDMPMRIMNYDGMAYRSQLLKESKERYPVVTLVLYFGTERPWKTPVSLLEMFSVPKAMEAYVSDYKINVFNIAYLSEQQVNMFTSDFKIVADYFVQKRRKKDYQPSSERFKHVDAILKFMSVFAGDNRYFDQAMKRHMQIGGITNMCEVVDDFVERGIKRGMEKGLKEGLKQGIEQGLQKGIEQGLQKGIERGLQQGIEQGIQQGMDRGRKEERVLLIRSLCQKKSSEEVADLLEIPVKEVLEIIKE